MNREDIVATVRRMKRAADRPAPARYRGPLAEYDGLSPATVRRIDRICNSFASAMRVLVDPIFNARKE